MFGSSPKGKFSARSPVTWLTLCLFMTTNGFSDASVPQAFAQIPQEKPAALQPFDPKNFPEALGRVEVFHQAGKDKPFVFFLQDAHAVRDAQRSIQNTLEYLETHQGVRLVALEGSAGKMDPLFFQTFPDKFVKKKVLNGYLDAGELSGAELAAASETSKSSYAGLEDWNLYQDNHRAYLEAADQKPEIEKALQGIARDLEKSRANTFRPELNRFHSLRESFLDEKSNLFDLLQDFKKKLLSKELNEELFRRNYPQLSVLLDASGDEISEPLHADIRNMAESLRSKADSESVPEGRAEFSASFQSFLTGQMDAGEFLRRLMQEGTRLGYSPHLTPAMQSLLLRTERLSMIKGTSLFRELESALTFVEKSMKPTDRETELLDRFSRLRRLRHLAALEMTREELEQYRQNAEGHLTLLGSRRTALTPALQFYRFALERDQVFYRNLETLMKEGRVSSAAVVAGGFHTQGLEEKLRGKGYSYAVISPRVESLEGHETYENLMKGNFSFKSYLETTYYDAFVRHAGIQLMEKVLEPEFKKNLKLWRDDVIRKLASEGRIDQVGNYTRYIDLLFKVYQRKFHDPPAQAVTNEELREALREELGRFQQDTAEQWKDAFSSGLAGFTKALLPLEQKKLLNTESVNALFSAAGTRSDALSNPRAMSQSAVLPWQKPDAKFQPRQLGIASEKVPFSPGNVIADALEELAREGAPRQGAVTESARASVGTLAAIARQAETVPPGSEIPVVRDVNAAKQGLRDALQNLPAPVPEMAREILNQGEARILGEPPEGKTSWGPAPLDPRVERVPLERSELRVSENGKDGKLNKKSLDISKSGDSEWRMEPARAEQPSFSSGIVSFVPGVGPFLFRLYAYAAAKGYRLLGSFLLSLLDPYFAYKSMSVGAILERLYGKEFASRAKDLIPSIDQIVTGQTAKEPFSSTPFTDRESAENYLRHLEEYREKIGRDVYLKMMSRLRRVNQMGYFRPNPLAVTRTPRVLVNRGGIEMVSVVEDQELLNLLPEGRYDREGEEKRAPYIMIQTGRSARQEVQTLQGKMIRYESLLKNNFKALHLISPDVMGKDELRKLLAVVDQMLGDYLSYTKGLDNDRYEIQDLSRVWKKIKSGLEDIRLEDPEAVAAKVTHLKGPRRLSEVESVHDFINYLHRISPYPIREWAVRKDAAVTLDSAGRNIPVYDASTQPLVDSGSMNAPLLSALLGGIVFNRPLISNLNDGEVAGRDVLVMNDLVYSFFELGLHKAELFAKLSPPDEGGMIMIRYQEQEVLPGNISRRAFVKKAFESRGFHVEIQEERYIRIVLDKDHGASTLAQLEKGLSDAVEILGQTPDLDIRLVDEEHGEAQALRFLGEGRYLVVSREQIQAVNQRLLDLGLEPIDESQLPGHSIFDGPPTPGLFRLTQERAEALINQPLERKLLSGEIYSEGGRLKLSRQFPGKDFLETVRGEGAAEAVRMAELVTAMESRLDFHPVGAAGSLLIEKAVYPSHQGERWAVTGLRNPETGNFLFAQAEVSDARGGRVRALSREELIQEARTQGLEFVSREEKIPQDEIESRRQWLKRPWARLSKGQSPVLKGIAAAPGTQDGVEGVLTFRKEVSAEKGKILFTSYTEPGDVPAIVNLSGIITAGGSSLAHAALVARDLGIPSLILPGAQWIREGEDSGYWRVRVYEPGEEVLEEQGFLLYPKLREMIFELREGAVVRLDGRRGTLTLGISGAAVLPPLDERVQPPEVSVEAPVAALQTDRKDEIAGLETLRPEDTGLAGPKAVNLGRLEQFAGELGYKTAPGFSVTTEAFLNYIRKGKISEALARGLEARGVSSEERYELIKKTFLGAAAAGFALERMIRKKVRELGGKVWAVRSSSVFEDSREASFAGAGETELYVPSKDIFKSVLRNFASFATGRSLIYREAMRQRGSAGAPELAGDESGLPAGMRHAVIVQEMVDADAAGVIVTQDLADGRRDRMVINAASGLGEGIVSGIVSADQYVLDKNLLSEIHPETGSQPLIRSKPVEVIRNRKAAGTIVSEIPPERRRSRALTRAETARLGAIAAGLETRFGYPLDIEFAIRGEDIFILQARPVTQSPRSELREYGTEGILFDKELNHRLVQLQWLWYGTDQNGQPHENNLYRQIADARAKAFPDYKAELDSEANRSYQSEVYKILERSYNHPEARRLLSEISKLPGVDPRIFFFHGSIYDAFSRSMTAVKEGGNKASRDYGDEMPSTPNFYRFDGYDFSDFHQVFVELVQNNQLHMKPNSTILALKHEDEKDLQLIYYYGNYNTHEAARIEESMYGASFTSGYGGEREHAFFNTIAPAVFQLGGSIRLEFDGKVQEFYPKNWAAWRWLRAWTPLWRMAWIYLSQWFFRSGIGKRNLGESELAPRRGIKITLNFPKKNLKHQPLPIKAPVNVESSRFRVPGGISEILVYSVYDEDKAATHVYLSTEEIQSGRKAAVSADLLFPGKPSETAGRHHQVIDFVRAHPFNYLDRLKELDPKVVFREGRRVAVKDAAPNSVFVTHLLTRFLPDIDMRQLRVADKEDDGSVIVLMTPTAVARDLEPRLSAFREYLLQSFESWEVQPLKPVENANAYGFVIRSELRAEEPPPVLELNAPREQYWSEIVRQLGLEKIATGGTAKIYKSSVYPEYLLKKKEIPETEIFRIEAPWNTDKERAQISAELAGLDLAVDEKPIFIRDVKVDPDKGISSNMTWQRKVIPVDNAWDPNPEKRPALARAVLENLKGLWKAGYFDADFKMGNLGIYTRRDSTRGAGLIDFDFIYRLPDSNDPEVLYQWLKKRDVKESDRLHFSAGEHFVSNFFYYENSGDEEEKAKKRDVSRLSFLRKILFPGQDAETARAAFAAIYARARQAYRALNLSPEESENPPLEKVRKVKQAILTAMDEEPLVDALMRQLAESISKVRKSEVPPSADGGARSELRTDSNPLAVSLNPEETAALEKRVMELSAFYKQNPMSREAREQFFYPGILSVFLGLRPGFLSYAGKDPDPLDLIYELEGKPGFPADYFSVMDPGMILDSRGAAERLVREGQFLFDQDILKESDKPLLEEVRTALQANDPKGIRKAVEPILSDLIEELLRSGGYLPKRQTNQDAIFGFLLGYPLPSIQAIMRWRLSGYDEELPPIQTVSPETKYPSLGITTDLTKESAYAVLAYHSRLEASLDYAYNRFAQEIPGFDAIEKALELPRRSELRAEEVETPRSEEVPDEFGFQPREWLEKLSRIRLFWEGENAAKFGEMKALIEKYKDVKGMRSMVSRLASSYLSGNKASFNEVAGELFIVDRLVDQLAPFYDVQVLGLGLYTGFREIDGFLKVTPKPGVEIPGPVLEAGLYILEAKEDDGVQLQGLIASTIKSQVSAQIRNAQLLAGAGLPFRGAIVGVGGERSQRASFKEDEKPEDSPVPVYSFVTAPFSIENNTSSVQVPVPSQPQLQAWNRQQLFMEVFFYKVLLPAFGLSPVVMGSEGQRRNAALHELERREKIQRDIARRNIQRKKKEREALFHELERRAREIEGWGDIFETLSDPEIKTEPLILKTILSWYFNRRNIPLEILRNDLHQASYAPKGSPETLTLPVREASSTHQLQSVHELQVTSAGFFSSESAWAWLKEQFQKSQQAAEPKATKALKPQTSSPRPAPKPRVEPSVREAHGWVSSFVNHEDVDPPLTAQDAGHVENILWIYFQGNVDRGQTVSQSRRQLQDIFSEAGRNGAWEWVQAQAEQLYGGPVDRSELRRIEDESGSNFTASGFDPLRDWVGAAYFGTTVQMREAQEDDYTPDERLNRANVLRFRLASSDRNFETHFRIERKGSAITALRSTGVPQKNAPDSEVKKLLTWDLILGNMAWLSREGYEEAQFFLTPGGPGRTIFVGSPDQPGLMRAASDFWKDKAGAPGILVKREGGEVLTDISLAVSGDTLVVSLKDSTESILQLREQIKTELARHLRARAAGYFWTSSKIPLLQAADRLTALSIRSELRTETLEPEDMQNMLQWIPGFNTERVIQDISRSGSVDKASQQVWRKEGETVIAEQARKLDSVLETAVLSEFDRRTERGQSGVSAVLNDGAFDTLFLAEQMQGITGPVNVYDLRDRLAGRTALLAEGRGGVSSASKGLKISEAQKNAASFLLNPARRAVLQKALSQHFGQEVPLIESKRLMMDLSLFEGTPFAAARIFIEKKLSSGMLALAYLKSTETAPDLAEIFRLPGLERHFYTMETPLSLKSEASSQTTHILMTGTLVENAESARGAPGVFVSKQVYAGAGLGAPEFEGVVQLALSVEFLRRQLEDQPGALFPELTESVLAAVFGLLEDLMTTEAARQAVASAA